MLVEFKYQGSTVEKSTLQKFNQGVCTDVSKYHPCLIFWYFFIKKKVQNKICYLRENKMIEIPTLKLKIKEECSYCIVRSTPQEAPPIGEGPTICGTNVKVPD